MNKLQHLNTTKRYLRKVVQYRRSLLKFNHGRAATAEMAKTMTEIEYNVGTINDFDRMMRYVSQLGVQKRICNIIPSNKEGWKKELQLLVTSGQTLQGKYVKQLEIQL